MEIEICIDELRELNNGNYDLPKNVASILYGLRGEIEPLSVGDLQLLPAPNLAGLKTGDDFIEYGQKLKEYQAQQKITDEMLSEWKKQSLEKIYAIKAAIISTLGLNNFDNNHAVFDFILAKVVEKNYASRIEDMSFSQATSDNSCDKFKKSLYATTELYCQLVDLFCCKIETRTEGSLDNIAQLLNPFIKKKLEIMQKKKVSAKDQRFLDQIQAVCSATTNFIETINQVRHELDIATLGDSISPEEAHKAKRVQGLFSMIVASLDASGELKLSGQTCES